MILQSLEDWGNLYTLLLSRDVVKRRCNNYVIEERFDDLESLVNVRGIRPDEQEVNQKYKSWVNSLLDKPENMVKIKKLKDITGMSYCMAVQHFYSNTIYGSAVSYEYLPGDAKVWDKIVETSSGSQKLLIKHVWLENIEKMHSLTGMDYFVGDIPQGYNILTDNLSQSYVDDVITYHKIAPAPVFGGALDRGYAVLKMKRRKEDAARLKEFAASLNVKLKETPKKRRTIR